MDKEKYLLQLRKNLSAIPKIEADEAIEYYEEYLADADDITAAIESLGSPKNVSAKIIASYIEKNNDLLVKKNKFYLLWLIILTILSAPLALPLSVALLCVLFAMGLMIITLFIVLIALSLAGIVWTFKFLFIGLSLLFADFPTAILSIGLSCLIFCLCTIVFMAFYRIVPKLINYVSRKITKRVLKEE